MEKQGVGVGVGIGVGVGVGVGVRGRGRGKGRSRAREPAVHVKGVDAANVVDGQYVPAGHAQR